MAPIYGPLSSPTFGLADAAADAQETRRVVIDRVGAILLPMLHLQCFRAHHDEIFRRNTREVQPSRVNKVSAAFPKATLRLTPWLIYSVSVAFSNALSGSPLGSSIAPL